LACIAVLSPGPGTSRPVVTILTPKGSKSVSQNQKILASPVLKEKVAAPVAPPRVWEESTRGRVTRRSQGIECRGPIGAALIQIKHFGFFRGPFIRAGNRARRFDAQWIA
jgi:hypothetical protein